MSVCLFISSIWRRRKAEEAATSAYCGVASASSSSVSFPSGSRPSWIRFSCAWGTVWSIWLKFLFCPPPSSSPPTSSSSISPVPTLAKIFAWSRGNRLYSVIGTCRRTVSSAERRGRNRSNVSLAVGKGRWVINSDFLGRYGVYV